jgi:hypothetical protein
MQLTKILLHGCNAFQESNKSHHHRRLLIPRPHTKAPETLTLLLTGKETNSGEDPGATQLHASTKNASRRELDVKGILDLKGKWKKHEEEEEEEEAREREREREREKERRNRDARKPNPLGVAFRAPTKP